MFGLSAKDIISYGVPALLTTFIAYKEWREKKARKRLGLARNPTSCKDHEQRLRAVEATLGDIKGNIKAIGVKIGLDLHD